VGAPRGTWSNFHQKDAVGFQAFNNISIMDNFMPHINGRAIFFKCPPHFLDMKRNGFPLKRL
jgi:hypothetical protein